MFFFFLFVFLYWSNFYEERFSTFLLINGDLIWQCKLYHANLDINKVLFLDISIQVSLRDSKQPKIPARKNKLSTLWSIMCRNIRLQDVEKLRIGDRFKSGGGEYHQALKGGALVKILDKIFQDLQRSSKIFPKKES